MSHFILLVTFRRIVELKIQRKSIKIVKLILGFYENCVLRSVYALNQIVWNTSN